MYEFAVRSTLFRLLSYLHITILHKNCSIPSSLKGSFDLYKSVLLV